MGDMLIIALREGIEAFLIVAIAAAYLRKTGRSALLPAVWTGTAAALAVSLFVGGWLLMQLHVSIGTGLISVIATATIGAVALLALLRMVRFA